MKWIYLPPLLIYSSAGVSGLTNIVGIFFLKDYLNLSAAFIASIGFWAGIPWALKMPVGFLVDKFWGYKNYLVYVGAIVIFISLFIMYLLLINRPYMEIYLPSETWFIISTILTPVGYVIQDVVADAMTVEAVETNSDVNNDKVLIKDKAEAAEKLESARKQRIVIETEKPSQTTDTVNIAAFARSTINKKGESVYARRSFQTFDHWTECAFFNTNENAQRFFLSTGGPKVDLKNLDPDGDGFACAWDPSIYRQLAIPADK